MPAKKKLFISHAAKDKVLADKLVDVLLNNGCDVPSSEIFCTSLEGMGIPPGTKNFIEFIRENIQSPSLVILLLSENYFSSTFCQCELGAAWGMDLPTFPLVVPPLEKAKLKATLAVTQAGDINDGAYLDELRDAIKDRHRAEVRTARWNVKKDLFLKELPSVLLKLPKPTHVPAAQLKAAEKKYEEALQELEEAGEKQKELERQISDLKKCKDREQVKAISAKYSTSEKQFKQLHQKAQNALKKLERATRVTLYWQLSGGRYVPNGGDEWAEVETAKAESEVEINEGETVWVSANEDHPRVATAENALGDLNDFLTEEKQEQFVEELTEDRQFPISLSNKEFWRNFLTHV